MDGIVDMFTAPVMPWDAIICTSQAVVKTIKILFERERDYLRWRLGSSVRVTEPQLPIIPLGVRCSEYTFTEQERVAAREFFGICNTEVVALYVGRLSFHAKAHPHPMYLGLQAAAERTAKKVALIQSGWFANASIETAFKQGAARTCPDVRALFTDGRNPEVRRRCWAAADFFISFSDNVQETFGLTPIEAMAAGLPVVVTDWDGYRDTVRHGIDGFRIATWMPSAGLGEHLAHRYEAGIDNYDLFVGFTCQTVSLDLGALTDHLSDVLSKPDLRRSMGAAGRGRAREFFDWTVVYRGYQALWRELEEIRRSATRDTQYLNFLKAAPKVAASRLDPFDGFHHYASSEIVPTTRVSAKPEGNITRYKLLANDPLYTYAAIVLPKAKIVDRIFRIIEWETRTVLKLSQEIGIDLREMTLAVSILAKMGLVQLRNNEGGE
jgi:glycosyltransferase involved in cell wall biosynthesis